MASCYDSTNSIVQFFSIWVEIKTSNEKLSQIKSKWHSNEKLSQIRSKWHLKTLLTIGGAVCLNRKIFVDVGIC